jgi:S-adenosylmethionine hydrolase
MILLFTDFGIGDPYIGQMHRAILQYTVDTRVVDLFHKVPAFNVKAASYLLAAYCPPVGNSVYCCVVDPGVGGDRAAIAIEIDDCKYVGPDNGLFEVLFRRYEASIQEITWRPDTLSNSFHGRDLFAPVSARLDAGQTVEARAGRPCRFPNWSDELDEIVYVDHYGNLVSGRRGETISDDAILECASQKITYARTFGDLAVGSLFWYRNANGLVEIAANQRNAAELMGIGVGEAITVTN